MRAMVYPGGGISALRMEELPDPRPGPGEIVVRVRACAMNHLDIGATTSEAPGGPTEDHPRILGSDVAGDVELLGEGVGGVAPGDRVVLYPGVPCEGCAECREGHHNYCPEFVALGSPAWPGGYAERMAIPAVNAFPVPEGLSYEEAASLPVTFVTAWELLVGKGQVQAGQWVLVNAAGSGVGSAAIQIAKLHGARVIATASTEEKREKALALGADAVVDYTREGWDAEVREIADGVGVHLCEDSVGGQVFLDSWRALRPRGRLVTAGSHAGRTVAMPLMSRAQTSFHPSFIGTRGQMAEILAHVAAGRLHAVIHAVLPIERAQEGHRAMVARAQFGKIVFLWS